MAQAINTSLKHVASQYGRLLGIRATASTVQKDIEENPYYPSLLSLSDTFDKYNTPNSAYKVPAGDFDQLVPPFIAVLNMPAVGKDFVLVTAMQQENVAYIYNRRTPDTLPKKEFLRRYEEIIWLAEPHEQSGDPGYTNTLKKEKSAQRRKTVLVLVSAITLLLLVAMNAPAVSGVFFFTITALKLAGLFISSLLLSYEIDKSNVLVKNICSAGVKVNCDAILDSKAAKIFGMSWSEIGFFYFASSLVWLLLPGIPFTLKMPWLAIANLITVPYIFFSIYYQWRVARQWCPLCLSIQAVLALEFTWTIFSYQSGIGPIITDLMLLTMAFSMLLPVVAWYALKPAFIGASNGRVHYANYKRLQFNPDIFSSLLQQQDRVADGWQNLGITIGDPAATNTLIKVCNPYCNPCAMVHPEVERLVEHVKDLNVRIIFSTTAGKDDYRNAPIRHLLAIDAKKDQSLTKHALNDWYSAPKKDYKSFAKKYPFNGELEQQEEKIAAMSTWCGEAEITHTPTFFVNGFRLPDNYRVEELKFIF